MINTFRINKPGYDNVGQINDNTFRINKPGYDNVGQINYNQVIQFITIFKLNSKTFV